MMPVERDLARVIARDRLIDVDLRPSLINSLSPRRGLLESRVFSRLRINFTLPSPRFISQKAEENWRIYAS